jgi:uncharacterized protein
MPTYKTPGVYVQEVSLFPPSVAEVATAIPAFIGYTEFAKVEKDDDLKLIPTKIKSLLEYETYFGAGYNPAAYNVFVATPTPTVDTVAPDARFYLYDSLRLFFDNGGGECYIVSVNYYKDSATNVINPIDKTLLLKGIEALKKYDEPTLILFPDAVGITGDDRFADLGNLQQQALIQCATLQDRFTVMDTMDGFLPVTPSADPPETFRQYVGMNNLSYGAAYYPWVKANFFPEIKWSQLKFFQKSTTTPFTFGATTFSDGAYTDYQKKINNLAEINAKITALKNGDSDIQAHLATFTAKTQQALTDYLKVLSDIVLFFVEIESKASADLKKMLGVLKNDPALREAIKKLIGYEIDPGVINLNKKTDVDVVESVYHLIVTDPGWEWIGKVSFLQITEDPKDYGTKDQPAVIADITTDKIPEILIKALNRIKEEASGLIPLAEKSLIENHPFFKFAADKIKDMVRLLPPSGAMVGIYAMVDRTRGVWKAPANVSVSSIVGPAVKIDNKDQENLNVHTTGKSINAIRAFTGKGTLVWGARTLAGNDNEWRYIPVRRFYNMVEESVKKATEPFTFEPNDKTTWVKVRSMIENYLTLQWRAGALQGAKPEDAFFVSVGLGETMTSLDILEGRMIVEIGMAVVRPAEFIILRFSHKMIEK